MRDWENSLYITSHRVCSLILPVPPPPLHLGSQRLRVCSIRATTVASGQSGEGRTVPKVNQFSRRLASDSWIQEVLAQAIDTLKILVSLSKSPKSLSHCCELKLAIHPDVTLSTGRNIQATSIQSPTCLWRCGDRKARLKLRFVANPRYTSLEPKLASVRFQW